MSIRIPAENKSYPKLLPTEPQKREKMLRKYGGDVEKFPHIAKWYEGLDREHYYTLARETLCKLCSEADKEKDPTRLEELRGRIRPLKRAIFETRLAKYENLDPEIYGDWSFPKVLEVSNNREYLIEKYSGDTKKFPHLTEEFEGLTPSGYREILKDISYDIEQAIHTETTPHTKKILIARLNLIQSKLTDSLLDKYNNLEDRYGDWAFPILLQPMGSLEREEILGKFGRDSKIYADIEKYEGILPSQYKKLIIEEKDRIIDQKREKITPERKEILSNRYELVDSKLDGFYLDSKYNKDPFPPKKPNYFDKIIREKEEKAKSMVCVWELFPIFSV